MSINPVAHALVLMRRPFYDAPAEMLADRSYLTAGGAPGLDRAMPGGVDAQGGEGGKGRGA